MEIIFILIGLSFPILYIVGLVEVVRNIFGKKEEKVSTQKSIPTYILEIAKAAKNNDLDQIKSILSIEGIDAGEKVLDIGDIPKVNEQGIRWFENWYSDNSINLLLYLGAFFIIVSAGTFVGFNWQNFSGIFKVFILLLMTLSFFGAGFYLYFLKEKVRRAGLTFIGIGSLLIPLNGWAFYNFVLKTYIEPEIVWFFTSLLGVVVWACLASLIRKKFFTYLAAFGFLSVVESLVGIAKLDINFYALGAIVSGFIMLLAAQMVKSHKDSETFNEPFIQTSYASIPIAVFVTIYATFENSYVQIATPFTTINTFLTAIYFLVAYIQNTNNKHIDWFMSQSFVLLGAWLFTKLIELETLPAFYLFIGIAVMFSVIGVFMKQIKLIVESQAVFFLSVLTSVSVYLFAIINTNIAQVHQMFSGILIASILWNIFFQFEKIELLYLKNFAWYLALWPFLRVINAESNVYPYFFVGLSTIVYLCSYAFVKRQDLAKTYRYSGLITAFIVAFFSLFISNNFDTYLYITNHAFALNSLIVGYFTAILFFQDSFVFKKLRIGILGSAVFMMAFIFNMHYLKLDNIQFYTLPIAIYFFGLAYIAKIKKHQTEDVLNLIGSAFLIIPTFAQALEIGGYLYALLLGFEGLALLVASVSVNNKIFRVIGIIAIVLAVASQTYEYFTSLPRWLVTGFVGLLFLSLAIYLLASRKDKG